MKVVLACLRMFAAAAADIQAGRAKAKPCNTCHGKDGIGTIPMFPNPAGQKSIHLAKQLRAFRDGSRNSEIMNIVVKALSDQDIDDLAAYYESLKSGGAAEQGYAAYDAFAGNCTQKYLIECCKFVGAYVDSIPGN